MAISLFVNVATSLNLSRLAKLWIAVDTAIREASNRKYSVDITHSDETLIRVNDVSGIVVGRLYRRDCSGDNLDAEIRTPQLQYRWTGVSLKEILSDLRTHSNLHHSAGR